MVFGKQEEHSFLRIWGTQPNISQGLIKSLKLPIPPLPEQTAIVDHIEKETAVINATIANVEKELALVGEYKTALIAEAVTGKIDVRDYSLPAEDLPAGEYAEVEEELSLAAEEEVYYEIETENKLWKTYLNKQPQIQKQ